MVGAALAVPLVVPLVARIANGAGAANTAEARERRARFARLKDILNECVETRQMLEKIVKDM